MKTILRNARQNDVLFLVLRKADRDELKALGASESWKNSVMNAVTMNPASAFTLVREDGSVAAMGGVHWIGAPPWRQEKRRCSPWLLCSELTPDEKMKVLRACLSSVRKLRRMSDVRAHNYITASNTEALDFVERCGFNIRPTSVDCILEFSNV